MSSNWELPHGLGGIKTTKLVANWEPVVKAEAEIQHSSIEAEAEAEILATPITRVVKNINSYKYGVSKFPDHSGPNLEQCVLVHQLLVSIHGEANQPAVLPQASKERAGCGDVAKVFEAVIRTIISSAITMKSANKMVQKLVKEFPMPDDSIMTINFDVIRLSVNKQQLSEIINVGGIQNGKAGFIKDSIDMVYEKNILLVSALQKELDTGTKTEITQDSPEFPALSELTPKKKTHIMALIKEDPLTLNWLHEITDDEVVLKVLRKLPGVGLKTAACVSLFSLFRECFAVDTHVQRFCTWLKWVPDNVPGNARDKTFDHLDPKIPGHLKYGLHQLFIRHGQECHRCKAGTKPGSKKWEETECVLENLLDRSLVYDLVAENKKNNKGNKGKKGKRVSSDTVEEGTDEDKPLEEEDGELLVGTIAKPATQSGEDEGDGEAEEQSAKPAGKKAGSRAKRVREEEDDAEYEEKPAKKPRVSRAKKGVAPKKVAAPKNTIKQYFTRRG